MSNCVAITGIGVVNPMGIGHQLFWQNLVEGNSALRKITRFDPSNLPVQVAGQINEFQVNKFVPRRLAVKMDKFAHYAVAASKFALEDADINLEKYDPYRVGVWFGNNAGGWDICERGLFELYREGATYVNPWQATAWFPTSPQGYVSIAYGIKGMCKSFICDRASSSSALYFATRAILDGECDIILAGGAEAPLTAFGMICYNEIGVLAETKTNIKAYKPFDINRKGTVLGEGSTVLLLEKLESAQKRGARIYGKLYLGSMGTDVNTQDYKNYQKCQSKALENAKLDANDIQVIYPEAAGTLVDDAVELSAMNHTFATNKTAYVACPKAGFGHLYGASTATDIAVGLMAAHYGVLPPTLHTESLEENMIFTVSPHAVEGNFNNMMFSSRAREGTSVSMVVTAG